MAGLAAAKRRGAKHRRLDGVIRAQRRKLPPWRPRRMQRVSRLAAHKAAAKLNRRKVAATAASGTRRR